MKVILVRHGAQDRDSGGLTPVGVQQIKDSAEKIKSFLLVHEISPVDIALISSPMLRAKQSADIISRLIGIELEADEKLASRSVQAAEIVEKYISEHSQSKLIIVVSHQPQLEDILEHFEKKFCRSFQVSGIGLFKGDAVVVDSQAVEVKKM